MLQPAGPAYKECTQDSSNVERVDICLQATSQQLHEALLRFSQLDGQVEALAAQRADSEARAGRWRERYRVSLVLALLCKFPPVKRPRLQAVSAYVVKPDDRGDVQVQASDIQGKANLAALAEVQQKLETVELELTAFRAHCS